MYTQQDRKKQDILFMKHLEEISNKKEIEKVLTILDDEAKIEITDRDNEFIEVFFNKIKRHNKINLSDTIYEFCEIFDIDILYLIQKNKRLFRKLVYEIKPNKNMREFF